MGYQRRVHGGTDTMAPTLTAGQYDLVYNMASLGLASMMASTAFFFLRVQLAEHCIPLLLAAAAHTKGSNTLSVQSKVLGIGDRGHDIVTLVHEIPDSKCILFQVTRSEALVSTIKPSHMSLGLHSITDTLPLLWCWVNAGGVVSAKVQHD